MTPFDRPKSVPNCNRSFGVVFVLSRRFLDLSMGVGAFVIGLSQIFFFFLILIYNITSCIPETTVQ